MQPSTQWLGQNIVKPEHYQCEPATQSRLLKCIPAPSGWIQNVDKPEHHKPCHQQVHNPPTDSGQATPTRRRRAHSAPGSTSFPVPSSSPEHLGRPARTVGGGLFQDYIIPIVNIGIHIQCSCAAWRTLMNIVPLISHKTYITDSPRRVWPYIVVTDLTNLSPFFRSNPDNPVPTLSPSGGEDPVECT